MSMNFEISPQDCNIRSSERTLLLEKLKTFIKNESVSPTFWACCQLADLGRLQDLVNAAQINPTLVTINDKSSAKIPLLCTLRTIILVRYSQSVGSQRFRDSFLTGFEASSSSQISDQSKKRKLNSDGQKWVQRSERERDLVCTSSFSNLMLC